jgi:hypothetical protein
MRPAALATLALLAVALPGCGTPLRSTPAARYQGMLLNARNLGADELVRQSAADPTIADYVTKHGPPDFILNGGPTDVQLVYAGRSVLAYFRRPDAGAPSAVYEVTPLPSGLLQILPADLRAGTAAPLNPGGPNCWTVPAGTRSCRTCCQGTAACVVQCRTLDR